MRTVLALLLLAFVAIASAPTLAAADVVAPMEQLADSADVSADSVIAISLSDVVSDADLARDLGGLDALQAPRPRARDRAGPEQPGPLGIQSPIWRPVARTASTLTRSYESGLALNRG